MKKCSVRELCATFYPIPCYNEVAGGSKYCDECSPWQGALRAERLADEGIFEDEDAPHYDSNLIATDSDWSDYEMGGGN